MFTLEWEFYIFQHNFIHAKPVYVKFQDNLALKRKTFLVKMIIILCVTILLHLIIIASKISIMFPEVFVLSYAIKIQQLLLPKMKKNRSVQFFNLLHELYCKFIRIKAKIAFCILFVAAINKALLAFLRKPFIFQIKDINC